MTLPSRSARLLRRWALGFATTIAGALFHFQASAVAHEGHAALPTKGASVEGNQLMVSAKALKALEVTVAKVVLRDLRRVIRARARVELPWYQQAMIASLVPGRIERVSVRPGEPVKKGQELARLESLELENFQRDLLRADAELVLTTKILEQREALGKVDAVSGVSVLQAKHRRDEAAADVVVAMQKLLALGISRNSIDTLRKTKNPLGLLTISSPIEGIVSEADAQSGQVISTTEHLYHIVDTSKLSIVAEILETDIASVRPGRPIRAEFPSSGVSLLGEIDHVHPALNSRTRIREAVAHVDNPKGSLKPGQSGRVEIEVERISQAIACPIQSLIETPDGFFVLVRRAEGRFERRNVQLGLQDQEFIEIRDGVFPGDQVVVVGKQLLAAMFHRKPHSSRSVRNEPPANARSPSQPIELQGFVELPIQSKHRISPRIDGRLVRIAVEPGQHVTKGQIVAEIDSLALRNLQLEFVRTRLEREWTTALVTRLRSLVAGAAAVRRELWEREAELVVLETELATQRSKLLAVGLPPEHFTQLEAVSLDSDPATGIIRPTVPLRAGSGGIVAHFDAVPGQVVHSSDSLFEVQDLTKIWVRGYAFERDAPAFRVGCEASLAFPAIPGKHLKGKIVRIAPVMGMPERVLPIWIEADNPDGLLPEGALARIKLESKSAAEGQVADQTRIVDFASK